MLPSYSDELPDADEALRKPPKSNNNDFIKNVVTNFQYQISTHSRFWLFTSSSFFQLVVLIFTYNLLSLLKFTVYFILSRDWPSLSRYSLLKSPFLALNSLPCPPYVSVLTINPSKNRGMCVSICLIFFKKNMKILNFLFFSYSADLALM